MSADAETSPKAHGAPLTGAALIRDQVRLLPDSQAVYRRIGEGDEVLYGGKSGYWKKRVCQYVQGVSHTQRILRMFSLNRVSE